MAKKMPASTRAGGVCYALPDVCLTPTSEGGPAPVPYGNTGFVSQAKRTASKVRFVGKEVVTKKSEMPRSHGDEAGVQKGVISKSNMSKVTYTRGSSKVRIQGQPCAYFTAPTAHNGNNANTPAGAQVTPSQTKVIVAS